MATRKSQTSASVSLPADRPIVGAIVADTHSRPHANIDQWLQCAAPDIILHAGDLGDLTVLDAPEAPAPAGAGGGK